MSNLEALDAANSRLRHAHAAAEALLSTYTQQGPGNLEHGLQPEMMCDALELLCSLLEQSREANAALSFASAA